MDYQSEAITIDQPVNWERDSERSERKAISCRVLHRDPTRWLMIVRMRSVLKLFESSEPIFVTVTRTISRPHFYCALLTVPFLRSILKKCILCPKGGNAVDSSRLGNLVSWRIERMISKVSSRQCVFHLSADKHTILRCCLAFDLRSASLHFSSSTPTLSLTAIFFLAIILPFLSNLFFNRIFIHLFITV